MRALIAATAIGAILIAVGASGQGGVPRAADGKPDLTGVWQGGSTQRGNWEEANGGTGVGGTGRNPTAPVVLSSNDRPAGREGAPYTSTGPRRRCTKPTTAAGLPIRRPSASREGYPVR